MTESRTPLTDALRKRLDENCEGDEYMILAAFDLSRRLERSHAGLVDALTKLAAEADGISEMARECIGNTNVNVLQLRVREARAALAEAGKVGK